MAFVWTLWLCYGPQGWDLGLWAKFKLGGWGDAGEEKEEEGENSPHKLKDRSSNPPGPLDKKKLLVERRRNKPKTGRRRVGSVSSSVVTVLQNQYCTLMIIYNVKTSPMRPDYVFTCIDHVTFMERRMDR